MLDAHLHTPQGSGWGGRRWLGLQNKLIQKQRCIHSHGWEQRTFVPYWEVQSLQLNRDPGAVLLYGIPYTSSTQQLPPMHFNWRSESGKEANKRQLWDDRLSTVLWALVITIKRWVATVKSYYCDRQVHCVLWHPPRPQWYNNTHVSFEHYPNLETKQCGPVNRRWNYLQGQRLVLLIVRKKTLPGVDEEKWARHCFIMLRINDS